MQGRHPAARSTPVAVHYFFLLGNASRPCDCLATSPIAASAAAGAAGTTVHPAPFLTYVREDDDYATLARRLGTISGDPEWAAARLAVVVKTIPHFIPRPALSSVANNAASSKSAAAGSSCTAGAATTDPKEEEETETEVESSESPMLGDDTEGGGSGGEVEPETTNSNMIGPQPNPLPATAGGSSSSSGGGSGVQQQQPLSLAALPTPWAMLCEHFPAHIAQPGQYARMRLKLYNINGTGGNAARRNNNFPQLGIQRLVAGAGAGAGANVTTKGR